MLDSPTNYALLGVVIVGMTEFLNRLRAKDYWAAATIATAAVIGGLFGFFGVDGLNTVVEGVAAGFGASGLITVFHALGSAKSAPSPSNVIE